jgi:hypothetical protein
MSSKFHSLTCRIIQFTSSLNLLGTSQHIWNYSWPSGSAISSTNLRSKVFEKSCICMEHAQISFLLLFHEPQNNSFHSTYIVLGIIRNLEIVYNIWEDVARLHTNTTSLYIRDLNISQILVWAGCPGTNPLRTVKEGCNNTEGPLYLIAHSTKQGRRAGLLHEE